MLEQKLNELNIFALRDLAIMFAKVVFPVPGGP